jgi:hypothetical protein
MLDLTKAFGITGSELISLAEQQIRRRRRER